jgi:hypothetical protein
LAKIAELAKSSQSSENEQYPDDINTPELRALFNNMGEDAIAARELDAHLRISIPDGWRGVGAKERRVKGAIFEKVRNADEVERLFQIILQQSGY